MELLSGNEAIARGAWEAGATIGAGYPGTPSTEMLETFATYDDVYAEWCTNEKVALEVGLGAAAAGARAICGMKHVGVNVAADPLYSGAYTGVNGGLVLLAADDPGMYSSQNEQDSHYHAMAAHIICLDPSDSQEALEFTKLGFELSEQFDTITMIRSTVRVSHTKCPVEVHEKTPFERKPYEKSVAKWVMMPAFARGRRKVLLERISALTEWGSTAPINKVIEGSKDFGVICAGAAYQHVKAALPEASILKLGITYPLPEKLIKDFADSVKTVYVVEEGSEYLTQNIKALGIDIAEAPCGLPKDGELSYCVVARAFGKEVDVPYKTPEGIPNRTPAPCWGCPHRIVFKEISRVKAIVTGDIGCYTLGSLPPLNGMDTNVDMGASISMAHGFELVRGGEDRPIIAVIGDSTFGHSGFASLVSTIYNNGVGNVFILDNRTTAMTGAQGNPFNGVTLQNRPTKEINIYDIVKAFGVEDVEVIDPQNVKAVRAAVKSAITAQDKLSIRIFQSPCQLLIKTSNPAYYVTADCKGCGICLGLGCQAITQEAGSGPVSIDQTQCIGCGQCEQYCSFNAIVQGE